MIASTSSLTQMFRQHKILVEAGVLISVTLLLLTTVIVPLFSKAQSAQSQLVIKEKEAATVSEQVQILTNLDPEILSDRMRILEATLPSRKDIVLYLASIDGLSRELALSIKGIQLQPGELATASAAVKSKATVGNTTGMHSLDTELKISGAQENIYAFLRGIEQTAPLMRVQDIKVTRQGEDLFILSVQLTMLYADPIPPTGLKGTVQLFTDVDEKLMQTLSELRSYSDATSSASVITGKQDLFTNIEN